MGTLTIVAGIGAVGFEMTPLGWGVDVVAGAAWVTGAWFS